MKMNKKLIVLVALVSAVVITGYSVSGTYAKYTSTMTTDSDSARVAKWYVNTKTQDVEIFKESYTYESNGTVVDSLKDDKVIAPGTKGEYKFTLDANNISVETNYKLVATITEENTSTVPMLFRVKKGTGSYSDKYYTYSDLQEIINTQLFNTVYAPTDEPSAEDVYTIEWTWPFDYEVEQSTTYNNKIQGSHTQTNTKDTELGSTGASKEADATATYKLTVKIDVVQTQEKASSAVE